MKAIINPSENARTTLVRLKVQQPRLTTSAAKGFTHQSFSSAWRSGVMLFIQRRMDACDPTLPGLHYAASASSRVRAIGGFAPAVEKISTIAQNSDLGRPGGI
jgi:hypothetical protein